MTTRLMAIYSKELVESPSSGRIVFPRALLVRYSLVEWLEFEKAFMERAIELGLDVLTESSPSGRMVISWRPSGGPQ